LKIINQSVVVIEKIINENLSRILIFIKRIFLPVKIIRPEKEQLLVNEKAKNISLYEYYACPFCMRVRHTINKLNIPIEYRDILRNSDYRINLLSEGGTTQVPCLRIEENGKTSWMYESREIIDYLERHFA
jgi:glutaredoxin